VRGSLLCELSIEALGLRRKLSIVRGGLVCKLSIEALGLRGQLRIVSSGEQKERDGQRDHCDKETERREWKTGFHGLVLTVFLLEHESTGEDLEPYDGLPFGAVDSVFSINPASKLLVRTPGRPSRQEPRVSDRFTALSTIALNRRGQNTHYNCGSNGPTESTSLADREAVVPPCG